MAVVAGVVFFVIRALQALIPGLAVSAPIKKRGRGGGAGCGCLLLVAVGRGGRDARVVLHDGRGADRGHRRPPRHHLPHARGGRHDRADAGAGCAGASELSELGGISNLDLISVRKPLEIQRLLDWSRSDRRERKPDKPGQKSRIGGEKSRKKSRTFAGCSAGVPARRHSGTISASRSGCVTRRSGSFPTTILARPCCFGGS
jgi:hypothetical protein